MAKRKAYQVFDSQDQAIYAIIWWDGNTIKCTNKRLLRKLKSSVVLGKVFTDGEEFFDLIPRTLGSYSYTRLTELDEDMLQVATDED